MVEAAETMTTSQIQRRLGHGSAAVTRRWLSRHEIKASGRDIESGEKTYDKTDIESAIRSMPIGPMRDRWQGRT